MAYVYDPSTGEEQKKDENEGVGRPTTSESGVASTGGAPTAGRPTSSGQFTNIQKYLRANQGTGLGQNVQNRISGQAQQVGQEIGKARTETEGKQTQAFQPFQGGQQFATNMIQSAGQGNFTDPDVQRFQEISQGQYKGPSDLQNFGNLAQNTANVRTLANLGNTESGRFALLKNMFQGRGNYSQGQQGLDQLLLQQQGTNLAGAKRAANAAGSQLNQARSAVQGQAKTYQDQVKEASEAATGGLKSAQTGLEEGLNARVGTSKAEQDALFQRYQDQLSNLGRGETEIDQDLMRGLNTGLGLGEGESLYNVNPLSYVQKGFGPTAQTVATNEDYNKYKDLSRLGNQSPTLLTDPNQAGTFKPIDFQRDVFQKAAERGKTIYEQDPERNQMLGGVNAGKEASRQFDIIRDSILQAEQLKNDPRNITRTGGINNTGSYGTGQETFTPEAQEKLRAISQAGPQNWDYFINGPGASSEFNNRGYTGGLQNLLNYEGQSMNNGVGPTWKVGPDYNSLKNLMSSQEIERLKGAWYGDKTLENQLKAEQEGLGYFQKLKGRMNGQPT